MSDFKSKLDKAAQIHLNMMLLITICKSNTDSLDLWGIYWESFWELSMGFPFKVEWSDPDTSYEEDIMQRYNAIDEFMKSVYSVREQDTWCLHPPLCTYYGNIFKRLSRWVL